MKRLSAIVGIVLIFSCTLHGETQKYLFSYFTGNGEDGLHFAESKDGHTWRALAEGRSFLRPRVGGKLMRDPCIIQGGDGEYHMVWTVGWTAKGIGYAHSKDLKTWSKQRLLPVMAHEPQTRNCWAPEITYDAKTGVYLVYWSSTIRGRYTETEEPLEENFSHRIYCTTTKDFKTFSPTRLLYDPGFSVIDATILPHNGKWLMVIKDETRTPAHKYLCVAMAEHLEGPYSALSKPITGNYWCEGPTVLNKDGSVIVYFDCYNEKRYGAVQSDDLITWKDISDRVQFPKGVRHGTIIQVPEHINPEPETRP